MFRSDGKVGWAPNGSLASSIVGMDHMVRHMKTQHFGKFAASDPHGQSDTRGANRNRSTDGSLEVGKRRIFW